MGVELQDSSELSELAQDVRPESVLDTIEAVEKDSTDQS
jgi:hypothetical protein